MQNQGSSDIGEIETQAENNLETVPTIIEETNRKSQTEANVIPTNTKNNYRESETFVRKCLEKSPKEVSTLVKSKFWNTVDKIFNAIILILQISIIIMAVCVSCKINNEECLSC